MKLCQDGAPDTGGTLKIYGEALRKEVIFSQHYNQCYQWWWWNFKTAQPPNVSHSIHLRCPTRPCCYQCKTQQEELSERWLRSTVCPSPRRPTSASYRVTSLCPRTGRRGSSSGAAPPGNTYLTTMTARSISSWTIRLDIQHHSLRKSNYGHFKRACFV